MKADTSLFLLANDRYNVVVEKHWYNERKEGRGAKGHWHEIIPCRGFKPMPIHAGSFIDLHSENPVTFRFCTYMVKDAQLIWSEIEGHPGCSANYMDGGASLYFPPELIDLVAQMAGTRVKRRFRGQPISGS